MRRTLLAGSLLLGVVLGACGSDENDKTATECLSADPAIEAAAREHAKVIVVGAKVVGGEADRVEVDTCRTTDENATATVTVFGIRDDSIRDQRHQMTLERRNARWVVVRDNDTHRCRKGRGHQDFSSVKCV